jgi:cell division protein FtsB
MKKRILNALVFLVAWGLIYWVTSSNFWFISFLFAYIFVYSVGREALIFLANEFDKNHNALADNVRELYDRLETLENENEDFRQEIIDLSEKISNLEAPKNKGFDPFYDFIDEIENEEKKAP